MTDFSGVMVVLSGFVEKEPMFITRFISNLLGFIINIIYNFVSSFTTAHALGLSIVLLTLVTRLIMLPLALGSQKSMARMQELNPKMDAIKKKYGDSKDPEIQQKINQETQTLYAEAGVNPLSGCLPLLLQMPIFFALTYIMRQIYLFIDKIYILYVDKIATTITSTFISVKDSGLVGIIAPIANSKVNSGSGIVLDISVPEQLATALNKFTTTEWTTFLQNIPAQFSEQATALQGFIAEKNLIDNFLGLNITDTPSLTSLSIIIPILAAVTSFLTTWVSMRKQKDTMEGTAATTQKTMMYITPLMMGFFTMSTPIGVGIYWITSNVIHIIQQYLLDKYYKPKTVSKKEKKK